MLTAGLDTVATFFPDLRRWRTALIHLNCYRHRLLLGCALGLGVAGGEARPLMAQDAPGAATTTAPEPPIVHGSTITSAFKEAPKVDDAGARTISKYISAEVALLSHPSPRARADARAYLERGVTISPQKQPPTAPSDHYLATYANQLNATLLKSQTLASPDPQVRLNAAIAIQAVAERSAAGSIYLAPAVLTALKDKAQPVVLWGAKSAQIILPRLLDSANPQFAAQGKAMADALLNAVMANPTSGPISEDVAQALTGPLGPKPTDARVNTLLGYVLKLESWRVAQYQKVNPQGAGLELPGSPLADTKALSFFSEDLVWRAAGRAGNQKQQVMRVAFDLMTEMNRLTPNVPATGAGGDVRRDDLLYVIRQGGGMVVVNLQKDSHGAEAKALGTPLTQVTTNTNPVTVDDHLTKLQAGLQQLNLLAPARTAPAAGGAAAPVARPAPAL